MQTSLTLHTIPIHTCSTDICAQSGFPCVSAKEAKSRPRDAREEEKGKKKKATWLIKSDSPCLQVRSHHTQLSRTTVVDFRMIECGTLYRWIFEALLRVPNMVAGEFGVGNSLELILM